MKVYVVSIPLDSARVSNTKVFKNEETAQLYCDDMNREGYHGYCNGLFVEEVEVIEFYKQFKRSKV